MFINRFVPLSRRAHYQKIAQYFTRRNLSTSTLNFELKFEEEVSKHDKHSKFVQPWRHLPKHLQEEVVQLLGNMEFQNVDEIQQLEFKNISDQYKLLAKKYHPDLSEQKKLDAKAFYQLQDKFLKAKESYDRILALNVE